MKNSEILKQCHQIAYEADKTQAYWLQRAVMTVYHKFHKEDHTYTLSAAWRFVKGCHVPKQPSISDWMNSQQHISRKDLYGNRKDNFVND